MVDSVIYLGSWCMKKGITLKCFWSFVCVCVCVCVHACMCALFVWMWHDWLSEHNWTEKYDLLPSNWFYALKNGRISFHGLSMILKCSLVLHGVGKISRLDCSPDIMPVHFFCSLHGNCSKVRRFRTLSVSRK